MGAITPINPSYHDLRRFFSDPEIKELLDYKILDPLYDAWERKVVGTETSYLTRVLLQSGIDPLEQLSDIPAGFLAANPFIERVVIPEGVNLIGKSAFAGGGALSAIILPSSLQFINSRAFLCCFNLSYIKLPPSVVYLGEHAFEESGLIQIDLKDCSIKSLPYQCFYKCRHLKKISLPKCMTKLSIDTFSACPKLTDIEFGGTRKEFVALAQTDVSLRRYPNVTLTCSDGVYTLKDIL